MDKSIMINFTIQISGIVLCLLCILLIIMEKRLDLKSSRFFILYFSVMSGLILFGILDHLAFGKPGAGWHFYTYATLYISLIFANLQAFMISMFFLDTADPKKRYRFFRYLYIAIFGFQSVMLTVSLHNGAVFWVDEMNALHYGPWNFPVTSLSGGMILIDLLLLLHCRKQIPRDTLRNFFLYFIIPIVGMCLQIFIQSLYILLGSLILATVIIFISFLKKETMDFYEREQDYERTKTALMLSQIQPHFLYNSLGVIQELCRKDPAKAEEATMIFSQFLRRNMDSLTIDRPIPFEDELEHTKNYLELEKIRFGDQLRVQYELDTKDFLIPTLTLQPLVENAVRHGIRQKEEGGTITIRTRDYPDQIEVQVQDDGPGTAPKSFRSLNDTGRIGTKNVSERLKRTCEGTLTLDFKPGEGVLAVITLPKKGEE